MQHLFELEKLLLAGDRSKWPVSHKIADAAAVAVPALAHLHDGLSADELLALAAEGQLLTEGEIK